MVIATSGNCALIPRTTAKRVPPARRMAFLPKYFGRRLMPRGEGLIYNWLRRLCDEYDGAYWHFYELPGGGFYLAPDLSMKLRISADNGFEGELSPDAAGIVATLYTLGQLAAENEGTAEGDIFIERYELLRAFASTHAESAVIHRAID